MNVRVMLDFTAHTSDQKHRQVKAAQTDPVWKEPEAGYQLPLALRPASFCTSETIYAQLYQVVITVQLLSLCFIYFPVKIAEL